MGASWAVSRFVPAAIAFWHRCLFSSCVSRLLVASSLQLSAMDVSVRSTMKGAAKCDKHCELQNSVNRQGLERILCFWDIPESMPASVSMLYCSSSSALLRACCCDCLCLRMCAGIPEASDLQLLCCSNQIIKYFRVQITGCSAAYALRRLACSASSQDMKLGQQTR